MGFPWIDVDIIEKIVNLPWKYSWATNAEKFIGIGRDGIS